MANISNLLVIVGVALLMGSLTGPGPVAAGDEAKLSIKVETDEGSKIELTTGGGFLQGLIRGADVCCEADDDRETRRMMSSLARQGEGAVYRGTDEDDGDFVARRRGGMLRIEKAQDDGKRTLIEMPWDVAQCLMAGVEPKGDLARRLARGEAKLRFETGGDGASVSIRLE